MQVSEEIINVLEYLCEKIGVTIDWSNKNILPYLEEICKKYIKWEINTSIAWMVISLVFTIITLILAIVIHKRINDISVKTVMWCCFAAVLIVSIGIISYQAFDIVTCVSFPEKAIYDYITTLTNTSTR